MCVSQKYALMRCTNFVFVVALITQFAAIIRRKGENVIYNQVRDALHAPYNLHNLL